MAKDDEHLNSPPEPEESDRESARPEETSPESSTDAAEPEPKAETEESPREEADEPQVLYEPPSATDSRSADQQSRSSFSPVLGLLVLLMLALGGATGYLYLEQQKFQKATLARVVEMETTLNSIHTDASRTETNSQQLRALKAELDQLKRQITGTLQAHQNTLSTVDEDILRLKEDVSALKLRLNSASASESEEEQREVKSAPEVSQEPETGEPDASVQERSPQRPEETQKYIDFVETTTQKFFRLIKEGIVKLWKYFVSLFD